MAYSGFFDTVGGILEEFGITGDTSIAVGRAFASPSPETIHNVEAAFEEAGASPPPELLELLWSRYYDSIQTNLVYRSTQVGSYIPWILGGGIGLLLLLNVSKGRRK